jgi:hypothetical protein
MNALNLRSRDNKTTFAPGETVEGVAEWMLDKAVEALELRLIWYTQGKGDADVSVEDSRRFEAPALTGSAPFRFALPEAPYSFSGKLISLSWALEFVVIPGEDAARLEFVLSPNGSEVLLAQEEDVTPPGVKTFSLRWQGKSKANAARSTGGALEQRNPFDT